MEAMPLNQTNIPKDEVNESMPRRSTRTIDVKEIKADSETPSRRATITNPVKSLQNGKANMQTPLMIKEMLVTTNDDTKGRSTKAPTATLPTVLETPMIEMIKAEESPSIPFSAVIFGR